MTTEQYRCLIAHMKFWKMGIAEAMKDAGIAEPVGEVISHLWSVGWNYDESQDQINYDDSDEDEE